MFPINQSARFYREIPSDSLHSTMFPINLVPDDDALIMRVLYIPLCFLLITALTGPAISRIVLYIPLCFLLIGSLDGTIPGREETLHSTMFPINQVTTVNGVTKTPIFTFHYVSY